MTTLSLLQPLRRRTPRWLLPPESDSGEPQVPSCPERSETTTSFSHLNSPTLFILPSFSRLHSHTLFSHHHSWCRPPGTSPNASLNHSSTLLIPPSFSLVHFKELISIHQYQTKRVCHLSPGHVQRLGCAQVVPTSNITPNSGNLGAPAGRAHYLKPPLFKMVSENTRPRILLGFLLFKYFDFVSIRQSRLSIKPPDSISSAVEIGLSSSSSPVCFREEHVF